MTYRKFCLHYVTIFFFLLLFTDTVLAGQKIKKANVFLESTNTVCWFNDQKYSEGSLIIMSEKLVVCANKFANQTNGQLVWRLADADGQPIHITPKKTININ